MADMLHPVGNHHSRRSRQLDFSNYCPPAGLTLAHRGAHCLDWTATHFPKQYTPYNILYKAIEQLKSTPQLRNKEVEGLRGRMQAIRKILQDQYGRELDSQPGIGVRATVDSADAVTTALPKKMRRLQSAKNAVVRTADLIDPSQLPSTPEFRQWKEWFNRDVRDVRKLLASDSFSMKLLPPSSESESE